MIKNKLKNYFILETLKYYFFILTTLTLLIWISQAARYLYLITEIGLSIENYTRFVAFLIPKTVSQLMLISFLISLFVNIIKFQTNKEIEIYWLSGISKNEIIKLVIKISFFVTLIAFVFFLYLAPLGSATSRQILTSSEFTLVNSLVKARNFNSPLKGLTIFVNKNDNNGNLEKVYIFENEKTIIAKKGRVINIDEKNYLELIDGIIHEKNKNNLITTIKFQKTIYDFTKYQRNIITTLKIQEQNFFWLLKEYEKNKNPDYLYEIHKRIFKPLFIPIISLMACFILFSNNEKINQTFLRVTVFTISTLFLIFFEVLLSFSASNNLLKYLLYLIPFFGGTIIYNILTNFLKRENFSR